MGRRHPVPPAICSRPLFNTHGPLKAIRCTRLGRGQGFQNGGIQKRRVTDADSERDRGHEVVRFVGDVVRERERRNMEHHEGH